ncbi:hypothetical protein LCGC14_3075750, partial [marine sediment metagenome]
FRACRRGTEKVTQGPDNPHHLCGMCIIACPYTRKSLMNIDMSGEGL